MPRTDLVFNSYYPCRQKLLYVLTQIIFFTNILASGKDHVHFSPENRSAVSSPELKDRDSYLSGFNGSLSEDHLEYMLDSYDEHLMKEYEFDPLVTVNNLIEIAQSQNTSSEQFQEEMKDLVVSHKRRSTPGYFVREMKRCKTFCKSLMNETCELALGPEKKPEESWVGKLRLLEEKYNVSSEPRDTNSATNSRLAMMFPHHALSGELRLEPVERYRSFGRPGDESYYGLDNSGSNIFKRPEFGGLIPRSGRLKDEVRKAIITVHLFLNYADSVTVPFRAQCLLLKKRIEKSLLSDERRVRLLQNFDVISEHGELRTNVNETNADVVPKDFRSSIFWGLLEGDS